MPRIVEFNALGGPEELKFVERDIPSPAENEIQLQMKAFGLNRAELLFIADQYLTSPILPSKIGVEGSGEIIAIGAGVEGYKIGDRVSVTPAIQWDKYGVIAEVANVPVYSIEPIPDDVSYTDAAAFWMSYGTAYGMMVQNGGLRRNAGQFVVITGASSSVGTAAFQIANAYGATSIATTRTSSKVKQLKEVGADHVIVMEDEDFVERIMEITGGKGFDIGCDSVLGPMVAPMAEAAAHEATIVQMGLQSGEVPELPFYQMLAKGLTLTGFHLSWRMMEHPDRREVAVEHLIAGLKDGSYKPIIDKVFELNDVVEAYQYMASNQQLGKIVIKI